MAEKDDESTPFDAEHRVDRDAEDDDAPPWLEDSKAGTGSTPAADAPRAEGESDENDENDESDWRAPVVDGPAPAPALDAALDPVLAEEGLIDRDNDDRGGFSAAEPEGRTSGAAPGATGRGLTDRDEAPGTTPAVDSDDPAGDALNARAERELAALGEDRYPLDSDEDEEDEEDEEQGSDGLFGDRSDNAGDKSDDGPPPAWRAPVDRDDQHGRPPLIDSDEDTAPRAAAAARGSRWPLALLAMGGLALVLVAVGGYGVIAERAALREEIRDLQARLATAATAPADVRAPAGADTAAALARIGDLENELAALAQENSALRARIGDLKGSLDAANGGGTAADDTLDENPRAGTGTAEGAAAASGASGEAPAPAPDPAPEPAAAQPATPAETWFVNFSSYAGLAAARRRAAELSVDAGRVVVQDAEANGRTVYRVRVVGIDSREAADAVARRLAATYQLPPLWVGRE